MENINVAVLAVLAMIATTIAIIYNAKNKISKTSDGDDVFEPIADPGIPGIIPGSIQVVTEETCCSGLCGCNQWIGEEEVLVKPLMITIDSITRIKNKSREFLMDSDANLTKQEADVILNDLSVPFDASNMNLHQAPFNYTIVK